MTYAQKLICEHKVPLAEVYSQLGYSEYSSFSHAYKKHFGVSPREHIGMPPNS
ncbi:helix-turn-helix domain-containing protein [Aeromonas sp. QDB14]